jgi:hypothetical protein
MPSKDDLPAINDRENLPNRRDSLRLLGGIIALAAGLGVPLRALGRDASMVTIKCYRGAQEGGQLLATVELPTSVTEYLASPAGARMQMKIYEKTAGELGTMQMPSQVQIKLQRASTRTG